jgi:hypothetical protein
VIARLRPCLLLFALTVLTAGIALPAHAQNRNPDSTLFTYYFASGTTQMTWVTCGSLPQTEGCYGSGTLGPYTNACAVVQSVPVAINPFTVTRYIYVLDTGSSPSGMKLTAYKRTDTVSQTDDTITITTQAVVPLPTLVGGTGVTCYMAQNPAAVYAGTNQGTSPVAINKSTYAVSQVGLFTGPVTAITADSYGYVTINQNQNGSHGNTVYAPNGQLEGDGGGSYFMINPIDAVNPANYPFTLDSPLPQVGYWPKPQ